MSRRTQNRAASSVAADPIKLCAEVVIIYLLVLIRTSSQSVARRSACVKYAVGMIYSKSGNGCPMTWAAVRKEGEAAEDVPARCVALVMTAAVIGIFCCYILNV